MLKKLLIFLHKLYKKWPILAFDVTAIPVAWYIAYGLRYNMHPFPQDLTSTYSFTALTLVTSIQIFCYYHFKIYRGLWRFSSLNDVTHILQAVLWATGLSVLAFYFASLLSHVPRSVLPLYSLVLVTLLCGGRLLRRFHWEYQGKNNQDNRKRVFIIGAGRAGESLARDLKWNHLYHAVGFIDDDQRKMDMTVHGISVLGTSDDLVSLVTAHNIQLLFIAIPSVSGVLMRRLVKRCEECHIPFRTLPSLSDLLEGKVEVNALREVHLDDLLGREEVQLQWDKIQSYIRNKRVLVTGGGGSIGSELCRQIMALEPNKLCIIDSSEFNLYQIEYELRQKFPTERFELSLVSVSDATAIDRTFHQFKPQIVFHAAAYKHVPLLESQIRSAVQNNVLGTQIVAEASVAVGVEKFILISTDKAVNPTNIMGTTKRIAEIYCQNLNTRVKTEFITVRFGNVLGSAGSVVPLFQKQLRAGGPLTVTHPDIERFFMTIPEACQLILQAMINGQGGEIFVLDMGEPIKIHYLAEQMIRFAGKEPGREIQIVYTGLRPGEKLYEELFHPSEKLTATQHEKLFQAKFREINWDTLTTTFDAITQACTLHQPEQLQHLLNNIVPEFKPTEKAKSEVTQD